MLSDLDDDARIDSGDAWLAFAAGQGWVTVAAEASPVNDLLSAGAAQGLIDFADRVTFLHRDQVDTLVAVTDEDGAVVEQTRRYPFGHVRWSSTDNGEAMGFTDKRSGPSGLVHIGVRVYDPLLGRWTATDPKFEIVQSGDANTPWEALGSYVYGWNTPLNGQDESGADWTKAEREAAVDIIKGISTAFTSGNIRNLEDAVSYKPRNIKNINRVLNKGWGKGVGADTIVESVSVAYEYLAHFRTEIERYVADANNDRFSTDDVQALTRVTSSSSEWRDSLFHKAAGADIAGQSPNFFEKNPHLTASTGVMIATAASMKRGFAQIDKFRLQANAAFGKPHNSGATSSSSNQRTVINGKKQPSRGLPPLPQKK